MPACLRTERLLLRGWLDSDREPFARTNRDPRVMEFLPGPLERHESDLVVDRIEQHFLAHGFGLYAAELAADQSFVGFVGLSIPAFDAPFMPAVEVGWRLAYEHWGKDWLPKGHARLFVTDLKNSRSNTWCRSRRNSTYGRFGSWKNLA